MSLDTRRAALNGLKSLLEEGRSRICAASEKDLGKSHFEEYMTDIHPVLMNISYALENLSSWTAGESIPTNLFNLPGSSYISPEPLGVVVIIGPWNVNIFSTFGPLVGALAAGNVALVKPGDYAPETSKVMVELIEQYLDPRIVKGIHGGPEITEAILDIHWDLLFFTGSTNIGQIIYEKAAKTLTPVVLELGGKSPCVVDMSVRGQLDIVAKRIVWGGMLNCGQICIRPDYILVEKGLGDDLVKKVVEVMKQFYTEDAKNSPWFGRIVNDRHFKRIAGLIADAKDSVQYGGLDLDSFSKYIPPTVINFGTDLVTMAKSKILGEEVFGPVLVIGEYTDLKQALFFIRARPKPLSSYIFSNNSSAIKAFQSGVLAGGLVVNDTIVQNSNICLPFGGVGMSGFGGRFQGKAGFQCFSNMKPVLKRSLSLDIPLRYPPYTQRTRAILTILLNPKLNSWLEWIKGLLTLRNTFDFLLISTLITLAVLFGTRT